MDFELSRNYCKCQNAGENKTLGIEENESVKALGLQWEPFKDEFNFCVKFTISKKIYKRLVLSNVAKISDPFGWLSPVTIVGKIFMQRLWLEEINWDQELDVNDLNERKLYEENVKFLEDIRIPR